MHINLREMKNQLSRILASIVILFSVVIFAASCSSTKTIPLEEGWDLLGETKVNFVRDRDELQILNTNQYTAVRFRVENKDVHIKDVRIVYPNGDKLTPSIDDDIAAGQYSKQIDLAPEGKDIRSILFSYRSTGSILKGRATVYVFGKRKVNNYY